MQNYRRISKGWKEYRIMDEHYKENDEIDGCTYRSQKITLSLCGDIWDFPEKYKTDGILIWPVYVNFPLKNGRHVKQNTQNRLSLWQAGL